MPYNRTHVRGLLGEERDGTQIDLELRATEERDRQRDLIFTRGIAYGHRESST